MIIGPGGVSPTPPPPSPSRGAARVTGPFALVGRTASGLRPPGRPGRPTPRLRLGEEFQYVVGHRRPRTSAWLRRDGSSPDVDALRHSFHHERLSVGRIRHQRPRTSPSGEVRGPPVPPRPPRPADRSGQPPAHPGPGRPDAGPGEAHPSLRWSASSSTSTTSRTPTTPWATRPVTASSRPSPCRLVGLLRTYRHRGLPGRRRVRRPGRGCVARVDGPEAIADRIRQVLRPAFFVREGLRVGPLSPVSASVGIAVGDRTPSPRTCCATPTSPSTG